MKADAFNKTWLLLTIIGIVCVVALIATIIHSLVHFFNSPPETKAGGSVVAAMSDKTANQPDVKSISIAGQHPFVHPVSEPASTPPATSQPQPASPQKSTGLNTNFKKMQEREKGRRATIENMRKTIRSGNLDTNAVMQQEKKLKETEDSGASFM